MEISSVKKLYGLIGYPLSHSFSKKHFSEKFEKEKISDSYYELFPLENIKTFPQLIQQYPNLVGLNVTIPYKEQVIPYLDELDEGANAIGAVNTIRLKEGRLIGFNTDVYGFEISLRAFLSQPVQKALVLGTGGAAKAINYVLGKMEIESLTVSRSPSKGDVTYHDLTRDILTQHQLIINTTPLGMSPAIDTFPDISYHYLSENHFLYDLVYNPEETSFMQKGAKFGAATHNGLKMLYLQAEKAYQIWTST